MEKILFNGAGVNTNKTDVGNYRIVSYFLNNKGQQCFIEISHFEEKEVLYGTIRQAFKFEGKLKKHYFKSFNDMYNIKFLLTKENVLETVNRIFKCNFDEMEVIKRDDIRWNGICKPMTYIS